MTSAYVESCKCADVAGGRCRVPDMTAEVRSTFHLRPYGLAASGAAASAARPYMHLCYTEKIDVLKRARLLCYLVLCVSRAVLSVVLGASSVRFAGWADWVDCRCFLSSVFLGVARRLELSPCNTEKAPKTWHRQGIQKTGNTLNYNQHVPPQCGFALSLSCNYNGNRVQQQQLCLLEAGRS